MTKNDFNPIPVLESADRPVRTVVFCADDAYAGPLSITMLSVLQHRAEDALYDIVVLHDGITDDNQARVRATVADFDSVSVRFFNIREKLRGISGR